MFEKIVSSIGKFSYKHRNIIALLGALLIIVTFVLQTQAMIEYTYAEESIVSDIFPQDDTVLIVYDNFDEEKIDDIIKYLERDEHVTSVQAYANTLGTKLSPDELSEMLGIEVEFINVLFYVYENGMLTEGMTFIDFVSFLTSDAFRENEMFSSVMDEETQAQLDQLSILIEAINSNAKYSPEDISDLFDVDADAIKLVFYAKCLTEADFEDKLNTILGSAADMLGVSSDWIYLLFDVTPVAKMSFDDFISTVKSIYPLAELMLDNEQLVQINTLLSIYDAVKENKELYPDDLAELLGDMDGAEMLNEDSLALFYIFSRSNTLDYSDTKIPLYDFFMFISEDIVSNESLSAFFDSDIVSQIEDYKVQMLDGKKQLVGAEHSRMMLTIDYVPESEEINMFYRLLTDKLDSELHKDYYLVGNTAMSYEVSQTFDKEFLIISIVTALVVFIVVLLAFRNLPVSILLIAVIECAIFAMMSIMTVTNSPIFFIALILVQCILMGTMIDYAILFTTYYIETRKTFRIEDALPEVMRRSTYAILTSSLILVLVTFVCGLFMEGTVAAILQALSIGAFCAIILILFVLPSLLVVFDEWIIKEKAENTIERK